jgi:hypothetical protein
VLDSSPPRAIREAHDHTGRGPKARLAARAARATASTASAKTVPWLASACKRASRALQMTFYITITFLSGRTTPRRLALA